MADQPTSSTDSGASCCATPCSPFNLTAVFLTLRLYMGVRLVLSGFEKLGYWVGKGEASIGEALAGKKWFGGEGFSNLKATVEENGVQVPVNQGFGDGKMWNIAKVMIDNTSLPPWAIKAYIVPLPYFMVLIGFGILLGIANRLVWLGAALLWFSLAFGQMLLPDEVALQWLFLYLLTSAFALSIVQHNRFAITRF